MEFRVEAGGLLDGFLDREDIGDLGADVEMDQAEGFGEILLLEQLGGGEQFGGAEAELGVFAA